MLSQFDLTQKMEPGYGADATATIKPWQWNTLFTHFFSKKSNKTQDLVYEAFFQKIWNQDWFAGAFVW